MKYDTAHAPLNISSVYSLTKYRYIYAAGWSKHGKLFSKVPNTVQNERVPALNIRLTYYFHFIRSSSSKTELYWVKNLSIKNLFTLKRINIYLNATRTLTL